MTTVSKPVVDFTIAPADTAVQNSEHRVLMLGQMTSAGTATAGELNSDVQDASFDTLFGAGGMLSDGKDMFRLTNKVSKLDVIALDDPAGTAAVGNILWDGTSTEAGELEVCGGSERNALATIEVPSGTDSDAMAALVTTAFSTLTSAVCTVTTDGTTTDQNNLTYNHDGSEGNYQAIYVKGTVAGITWTITGYTGGAGVPTLTNVFDVTGTQRYQTVIIPGSYGTTELAEFLDGRWNVTNRILDGVGIVTVVDAYADHATALASENSKCVVYNIGVESSTSNYKGREVAENAFAQSCDLAASRSLRLTTDANVSTVVDARGGALDNFGGPALCSKPYFNTPSQSPTIWAGLGLTDTQADALQDLGGTIIGNNVAGTTLLYSDVVTTYKTDASGMSDSSFKYLNSVDTNSVGREYMFNNVKRDIAQSRLTSGDVVAGRAYVNVEAVETMFKRYYGVLSGKDYCVTVAGEEALQFFEDNLSVSINTVTGIITAYMVVPIVVQARRINAVWQMNF